MSLAITGDALAVFSAALLTFGTGAQALANLAEFKSLKGQVDKTMGGMYKDGGPGKNLPLTSADGTSVYMIPLIWISLVLLFRVTKAAARIRAGGGEQGAQLAQFLRLAEVWGIIALGSALALAAAVIQLRLALK